MSSQRNKAGLIVLASLLLLTPTLAEQAGEVAEPTAASGVILNSDKKPVHQASVTVQRGIAAVQILGETKTDKKGQRHPMTK